MVTAGGCSIISPHYYFALRRLHSEALSLSTHTHTQTTQQTTYSTQAIGSSYRVPHSQAPLARLSLLPLTFRMILSIFLFSNNKKSTFMNPAVFLYEKALRRRDVFTIPISQTYDRILFKINKYSHTHARTQ